MAEKSYQLSIDPHILELLGPSLYTNIYYILSELIANSYDADARNAYVISKEDRIVVEDDGVGMSYKNGDVGKYLEVAVPTRNNPDESKTQMGRVKMGRKGIGKLAALSVSNNVHVKTIKNGEKSGFVLSTDVGKDGFLKPLSDEEISFEKITGNSGTSVAMFDPKYKLHSTTSVIKKNLLKMFPLVDDSFKIHIIHDDKETIIERFDEEIIKDLSALITLGDFDYLCKLFRTEYPIHKNDLLDPRLAKSIKIVMKNKEGKEQECTVEIRGWIGAYASTKNRKADITDFPDNFISLYANGKLGEFNILPTIGQNKLNEVYVVGQLHIDAFEQSDLPDMALSNRQGYKSDDPRYEAVIKYVRDDLLPEILKMRRKYADLKIAKKQNEKLKEEKEFEDKFRKSVDTFRENTATNAAEKISMQIGVENAESKNTIKKILSEEINANSPDMGIKSKVDSNKKKILISQTFVDKDLADVIYDMLIYNGVSAEDIIYTNCDDEVSRIPEGDVGKSGVYKYLREFFVDSYSTQKIYAIFVTSNDMKKSWGALTEVGAAWITQIEHKIFNLFDFRPEHPLDDENVWHNSLRYDNEIYMNELEADRFSEKIEYICEKLGYEHKDRKTNRKHLGELVNICDHRKYQELIERKTTKN